MSSTHLLCHPPLICDPPPPVSSTPSRCHPERSEGPERLEPVASLQKKNYTPSFVIHSLLCNPPPPVSSTPSRCHPERSEGPERLEPVASLQKKLHSVLCHPSLLCNPPPPGVILSEAKDQRDQNLYQCWEKTVIKMENNQNNTSRRGRHSWLPDQRHATVRKIFSLYRYQPQ